MPKRMLAILTLTGLSVFLIGAASANDDDKRHGKRLVGIWVVAAEADLGMPPPFTNIITINRDGTLENKDASLGEGVGVWKHARRRQFTLRFAHLIPLGDPDFPDGSFLTVTGRITVHKGGDSADGTFLAVFANQAGDVLFSPTGTVAFKRITIDDHD